LARNATSFRSPSVLEQNAMRDNSFDRNYESDT
jgi:hypothetical protein